MRRLTNGWLLIGLVWLLLIAAVRGEDLAAQGGASGNSYQMDGRYVRLGALYWDKETGHLLLCGEGEADCPPGASGTFPTPSPASSSTPTLTPSSTPPPTNTPRPSATPTPTATPGTFPTPTQEMKCWGTVTASRLNVRDTPGGNVLGQVVSGDTLALEGVRRGGDGSKWYLIYWLPDVTGFVSAQYVEIDPGAQCDPFARGPGVGWTLAYGYDAAALDRAAEMLMAGGLVPSVTLTSNSGEACGFAGRGFLVNVRPWYELGLSDHPDLTLPSEASARARIEALAGYVGRLCADSPNVAIQLTNETSWPSASYLTRWVLEAVRQCDARGWTCLPVVFSTGTPEESWMQTYRPALAALERGGHYFGYNAYPYQRDLMLCDAVQEWTTWRVLRLKRAAGEPFPRVWVTEAARGAGDVAPIVSDARCYIERAIEWQAADVINLWYAGGDSVWGAARWSGEQTIELARALAARP